MRALLAPIALARTNVGEQISWGRPAPSRSAVWRRGRCEWRRRDQRLIAQPSLSCPVVILAADDPRRLPAGEAAADAIA